MRWRLIFTVAGISLSAGGMIGLRYALTPGFRLDPTPGFSLSLAVIAVALGAWSLWLAWHD